ncbi:hypothetical protein LTR54_017733 [Friedmanniomyces endolithicus]|uniref:Uncharacterized protein n=1 Tax=Friedmanniomyces endolithicus TaxID=329885 RepID=A0AAN6F5K2_9PEZI|nr:hypothetical protein LTR82_017544 [Friedmanniomyces endolithicus]KAK0971670.1 hypothetical protein LTR54_017733 [Friedmanniomyces endolithicus]
MAQYGSGRGQEDRMLKPTTHSSKGHSDGDQVHLVHAEDGETGYSVNVYHPDTAQGANRATTAYPETTSVGSNDSSQIIIKKHVSWTVQHETVAGSAPRYASKK